MKYIELLASIFVIIFSCLSVFVEHAVFPTITRTYRYTLIEKLMEHSVILLLLLMISVTATIILSIINFINSGNKKLMIAGYICFGIMMVVFAVCIIVALTNSKHY